MQLGTRWTSGDEPPTSVPSAVAAAVRDVDATLGSGGPRPRWTLTWLEGRPIAELDSGVIVELDAEGAAVVRHDDEDEFG
ncbi:hypothetical protein [Microbacterium invictum]|uniref:Fe-S oxidoreductase n=1 Tax=Microbacterium invictum TaxID=515415 RepID=A0ABZ0V813_9MICO|nr:hypothetical protein [Microbacterium invictum]WQB68836.1 hypothetical protein T9R20_08875 [Microbacterium invictum]